MAGYIGSKASVVSSGAERKKTFAITTTTTSLTGLSYTPTKVHVFHNGVRLVDGTDYTATNGTSITLTSAAESGDQVVVVSYATFQVADAYTQAEADAEFVQDPSGAITVSGSNVGIGTSSPTMPLSVSGTGGAGGQTGAYMVADFYDTSAGAIDVGGAIGFRGNDGVNSNVGFGTIGGFKENSTSGNYASYLSFKSRANAGSLTERMRIDSSGRVTTPYQPSFQAWSNSGGNEHFAGGTNPSFLTISSNVGNHFNGTTFTAPVSGRYLFFYTILSGSSGDYGLISLNVNGGPAVGTQNWTQHYTATTNDQQNSGQQILTLSANDQVNLYIHPAHNRFYWNNAYSKFGGHLIG